MDDQKKNAQPSSVEEMKSKGNECVKDGKYIEAVLHYTQGIKLDPNNYVLHSNRSFAFLKLDQHYLALQDANETVRLQPNWAKGYFRRAEVEAASELYDEALVSYTRALQFEPQNDKIIASIKSITDAQKKKIEDNQIILWICTAVGFVMGIIIVICDYCFTSNPALSHPLSQVAFALALAATGFALGKTVVIMKESSAGKSLTPPEDLNVNKNENETVLPEKKYKYTKAQARHRYKQGKI